MGCSVSDHGLEQIYAEDYTDEEIETIFNKIRSGKELIREENLKFKSAMLQILQYGIGKKAGCSNIISVHCEIIIHA